MPCIIKTCLWLATRTPVSLSDRGYSFFLQWLFTLCQLQQSSRHTHMTLKAGHTLTFFKGVVKIRGFLVSRIFEEYFGHK